MLDEFFHQLNIVLLILNHEKETSKIIVASGAK